MKNLKYIMATLMVALIVAVVCVACNKDKETPVQEANNNSENEPNTEVVERKPIAVFDKNTGVMTTLIDINSLNAQMKEFYASRGDTDRYVIESVEVLDTVPYDKNVTGEIKIIILDTEDECSYSIWCMKSYTIKDVKEHRVDYYVDEIVASGNFDFAFKSIDRYFVANFDGNTISAHEVDPECFSLNPKIMMYCKSLNCEDRCVKAGSSWHAYCKQCPLPNGSCMEESYTSDVIATAGVIIAAIGVLAMLV